MHRVRNSSYRLPPHQERALDAVTEQRTAELSAGRRVLAGGRLTAAEKRLFRSWQSDLLKIDTEAHRKTIAGINQARADRMVALRVPSVPPAGSSVVMTGEGDGTMPVDDYFWWMQTTWTTGHGIDAQYLLDGLHFFGHAVYEGDERITFSVGATADFGLDPSRRAKSDSGKWRSTPPIELNGQMWGSTGFYNWLWAADDKWLKCFLFTRQTLFQFLPDGSVVTIGDQSARPALIDEENSNRPAEATLLGSRDMPAIDTSLYDPDLDIIARLEIRFDIELEGWADIFFNPPATEPSVSNAIVLRTLQWPLVPV